MGAAFTSMAAGFLERGGLVIMKAGGFALFAHGFPRVRPV